MIFGWTGKFLRCAIWYGIDILFFLDLTIGKYLFVDVYHGNMQPYGKSATDNFIFRNNCIASRPYRRMYSHYHKTWSHTTDQCGHAHTSSPQMTTHNRRTRMTHISAMYNRFWIYNNFTPVPLTHFTHSNTRPRSVACTFRRNSLNARKAFAFACVFTLIVWVRPCECRTVLFLPSPLARILSHSISQMKQAHCAFFPVQSNACTQ